MFELHKKIIINFLEKFLLEKKHNFSSVNNWSNVISHEFFSFLKNGKMIRGSLVLQSYLFFKDNVSEDVVKVASAIELIHSSLLIHDDIMDKDVFRRGQKTISEEFTQLGKKENFINADHFGNSMGISIGDLGFFLGFELLSSIKQGEVMQFVTQELSKVTLAQMDDVYGGFTKEDFSKEKILSIYNYKTGRYSLSLPLMLGAILAGESTTKLKILEDIGEKMGILFQIKDDEINIFGKEEEIGKPVGSDIRENKKTIFRFFLYELAQKKQKENLKKIFGNKSINISQIKFVQDLIKDLGVLKKINEMSEEYESLIKDNIKNLKLPENKKRALLEFLEYNLKRKK